MPHSKAIKRYKVRYNGRYSVKKDDITAKNLYLFFKHCNTKPKFGFNTLLNTHEIGFHVGHASGLRQVNKRWFKYSDIVVYYIFMENPNVMILSYKEKGQFYTIYLKFTSIILLDEFENQIKNSSGKTNQSFDNVDNAGASSSAQPQNNEEYEDLETEITNEEYDDFDTNKGNVEYDDFEPEPVVQEHSAPINYLDEIINENDHQKTEERSVDVRLRSNKTMKMSTQIDSLHRSNFYDIFHLNDEEDEDEINLKDLEADKEYKKSVMGEVNDSNVYQEPPTVLIENSTYIYSKSFAVPVIELYGDCEYEDAEA